MMGMLHTVKHCLMGNVNDLKSRIIISSSSNSGGRLGNRRSAPNSRCRMMQLRVRSIRRELDRGLTGDTIQTPSR